MNSRGVKHEFVLRLLLQRWHYVISICFFASESVAHKVPGRKSHTIFHLRLKGKFISLIYQHGITPIIISNSNPKDSKITKATVSLPQPPDQYGFQAVDNGLQMKNCCKNEASPCIAVKMTTDQ